MTTQLPTSLTLYSKHDNTPVANIGPSSMALMELILNQGCIENFEQSIKIPCRAVGVAYEVKKKNDANIALGTVDIDIFVCPIYGIDYPKADETNPTCGDILILPAYHAESLENESYGYCDFISVENGPFSYKRPLDTMILLHDRDMIANVLEHNIRHEYRMAAKHSYTQWAYVVYKDSYDSKETKELIPENDFFTIVKETRPGITPV